MSKIKELKNCNFATAIIALVLFLRAYLLSDRRNVAVAGFFPLEFDFSSQSIALLSLLAVFAVLASLVLSKLGKKYGNAVSYLSFLLVAEPLLFAKQENCVNLVIWIIGLLFVLSVLAEKSFIPKEIMLVVFLLVSCVLTENAIFLFVAPALVLYIAGDIEKLAGNTKKIITLIISLVATGAGVFLNDYLVKNVPAFDEFIKSYSFYKQIYFKHIKYENVLLFAFAILTLIFGVVFFVNLFKNSETVASKKSGKKAEQVSVLYNPVPVLVSVIIAYALSVTGFIIAGSNAFYTINYIIPAAVISMLCSKNSTAEKALENTNKCFSKYSLAVIIAVVLLCYVSVRIFYYQVDNLASFITTI